MIKKYYQFLKLNEDVDFDDWDFEEEEPVDEEEMVEDYNGYEIPKSEAVECDGGEWCHEDEALWSEYDQIYVLPNNEDYIWIENVGGRFRGGDYIHREDVAYSNRDGEHYMMNDVTWCEYEDDCCLHDEAVECEDGECAFQENVVEDSEGKIRYINDIRVVYNDETGEYDYTE